MNDLGLDKHQRFLQQAISIATDNVNRGGGPYGAVIVKAGAVIVGSGNRVTDNLDPTAHAEVMTIRLACQALGDFQLDGCVLYSSCEPCPMCLGAIYWARLDQVYFAANRFDAAHAGFDDSFIYNELDKPALQRRIRMQQLTMDDAGMPFNAWHANANKVRY